MKGEKLLRLLQCDVTYILLGSVDCTICVLSDLSFVRSIWTKYSTSLSRQSYALVAAPATHEQTMSFISFFSFRSPFCKPNSLLPFWRKSDGSLTISGPYEKELPCKRSFTIFLKENHICTQVCESESPSSYSYHNFELEKENNEVKRLFHEWISHIFFSNCEMRAGNLKYVFPKLGT